MSGVGAATALIGGLLLMGLLADWVAARLPIPRVTVLILLGVLVGPIGLDVLPATREQWFPVVSAVALVMVGFLIGGEFTRERLRELGTAAAAVATSEAFGAVVVVAGGLLVAGVDPRLALPLAGVAAATAPAAVTAVVQEYDRERPFSRLLLAVVAFDDALGLVLFSLLMAATGLWLDTGGLGAAGVTALRELGGGVVLGVGLGLPAALLTGRLRPGRPVLEEALGLVLVCAGIGLWLEVSYVLAAVAMGVMVANLAEHHEYAFREIEGIEWPFLVLFFVLSGAALELASLTTVGAVVVGYLVLRSIGKIAGAWIGARAVGETPLRARWLGPALLPQAGIALGLGLLAEQQLPGVGGDVLATVVAATIVFELVGPVLTRLALQRTT